MFTPTTCWAINLTLNWTAKFMKRMCTMTSISHLGRMRLNKTSNEASPASAALFTALAQRWHYHMFYALYAPSAPVERIVVVYVWIIPYASALAPIKPVICGLTQMLVLCVLCVVGGATQPDDTTTQAYHHHTEPHWAATAAWAPSLRWMRQRRWGVWVVSGWMAVLAWHANWCFVCASLEHTPQIHTLCKSLWQWRVRRSASDDSARDCVTGTCSTNLWWALDGLWGWLECVDLCLCACVTRDALSTRDKMYEMCAHARASSRRVMFDWRDDGECVCRARYVCSSGFA